MNRHIRRSRWFLIPLFCFLVLAGGCKEQSANNRSTLQLSMERSETLDRSLLPQDTVLEVSRYAVEGDGPQGSTFSVISTTDQVEVEGLLIGNWNLRAVGQNNQGLDLVEGSTTVNLTSELTEAVLELNTLSGEGIMTVHLGWDSTKIADPVLDLFLTDDQGVKTPLTPTTNNLGQGMVTYTGTYTAGSYLLQAQLYSGSVAVAGCAEIIRVVSNKTTEGTITLNLDKYASIPTNLTLVDNLGVPVQCTISGISETVEALQSTTATLTANNVEDTQSLSVDWYLDGQLLGSGLSCTFTPSSGSHRLDVIAKGARLASSGSASISFQATVSGQPGIPVLVSTVADTTNGLSIGSDAQVAFLPDGKILLASNAHQTIQVCRIVRETLEVMHTYTNLDGFNASGITDVYIDNATYRVAIADSVKPGLTIYQYDLATSSLTKLFDRSSTYYTSLSFPYLTDLSLDRMSGILYGLAGDKPNIVETNLYANNASDAVCDAYVMWFPPSTEPFDGLAIAPGGKDAAVVESSTGLLRICNKDSMGALFANPVKFTPADTPYINNIDSVAFLNDDNLLYATDDDVGRFERVGSTWTQQEVFTTDLDGVGSMQDIIQIERNVTGNSLYILSGGSRNLTTFTATSPSYALAYGSTTELGDYLPSQMAVSPKLDHLVVVSSANDSLLLFQIP